MNEIIYLQDGPGGGNPPGGGGSSSVSWSGATEISSAGTYSSKTYKSTTSGQNALLVTSSGKVVLKSPTVTKSGGTSAGDDESFYGINSAICAKDGGTTSISGGTVTTSAAGANGIFSYGGNGGQNGAAGDGTTVIVSNVTIKTTGNGSGGIMTTGGSVTKASNLTITTTGQSSAAIRTDRGGGTVSVSGGSYTSSGLGSPAIYSTAEVSVSGAKLVSNKSEGVCIEGQNSVALTNCTLTASNSATNGNAKFLDTIMIYQSMSGDSSEGTSTFTMTGGTINSKSGHVFHVTNTTAIINLNGVTINNTDSDDVLLSVCDDGWSGASNIATVNASGQTLSGKILVGDDSTLNLNLSSSSTFKGSIGGSITNASGSSVSTSVGTVNVTLASGCKWYLTGDTEITSFDGNAANVITNGYSILVNGSALSGTTDSDGGDDAGVTVSGGVVKIDTDYTGDTIDLSDYSSTVTKVNAAKTTKGIEIIGNKYANSLKGGSGADTIIGNAGNDTLIGGKGADSLLGGYGNDYLSGGAGNDTFQAGNGNDTLVGGDGADYLSGGYGNDSILGGDENDTLLGGSGNDYLSGGDDSDSLIGGAGKDTLYGGDENDYLDGGKGNDSIFGGDENDTLLGGSGNDYLSGGGDKDSLYGGTGADTLYGGAGNDTLTGGKGADVFVYRKSTGKDIITDYTAGTDKIKISSGSISKTSYSGNDVIFKVGSGTLTVKNGNGKKITIEDSSGTVTSESYLTADNLSAIVENNLSAVNEIENQDFDALMTQENLITFAEK